MQQQQNSPGLLETELLYLADNMASAATTFNAHGYEVFLQARERLKEAIHDALAKSEHQ
jgi:hypothetical protein